MGGVRGEIFTERKEIGTMNGQGIKLLFDMLF
jgi:hypothetical protein